MKYDQEEKRPPKDVEQVLRSLEQVAMFDQKRYHILSLRNLILQEWIDPGRRAVEILETLVEKVFVEPKVSLKDLVALPRQKQQSFLEFIFSVCGIEVAHYGDVWGNNSAELAERCKSILLKVKEDQERELREGLSKTYAELWLKAASSGVGSSEEFSAALRALTEKVIPIAAIQVPNAFLKEWRIDWDALTRGIQKRVEQDKIDSTVVEKLTDKLLPYKWPIAPSLPSEGFQVLWEEISSLESQTAIDAKIVELFDAQMCELIVDEICHRLEESSVLPLEEVKKRVGLIRKAFKFMRAREWEAAVLLFLTMADGLCKRLLGKELCAIYKEDAGWLSPYGGIVSANLQRSFREVVREVVSEQTGSDIDYVARNPIMHGMALSYGTQATAIRSLLILDFVSYPAFRTRHSLYGIFKK